MAFRYALVPVPVPSSLDDPAVELLAGAVAATRVCMTELEGNDDIVTSVGDWIVKLNHQQFARQELVVAVLVEDGDGPGVQVTLDDAEVSALTRDAVIGNAGWSWSPTTELDRLDANGWVLPQYRRRGVGSAFLDRAREVTRDHEFSTLAVWADHGKEATPAQPHLVPETGSGLIPADGAGTRFLTAAGFRLGQAERHSVLTLPVDTATLDGFRESATAASDADYRLVQWVGACPEQWVEQYAALKTRMSTDIPTGALEPIEELVTADQVRDADQQADLKGHVFVTTAAEHVASGELVAFSILLWLQEKPGVAFQEDTLVLAAHRGKRLGMRVKVANLDLLAEHRPQVERVHTWNAEENSFMLSINVALGFRPATVEAQWLMKV